MVAIGMEEFSFNDVLRPEVSRLRVFLSAAINFIRFREDQLHIFNEYEKHSVMHIYNIFFLYIFKRIKSNILFKLYKGRSYEAQWRVIWTI